MRARHLILPLLVVIPLAPLQDAPPPTPVHRAIRLPAGDVTVRAVQAGSGTPSILLLHGFGESLVGWQGVFDRLAATHHVTAVDLPGFGLSDKPPGGYDLDGYVRRVSTLLEGLPAPRVVVGHSMGGEVAAAVALAHPGLVDRLVLMAPAGDSVGLAGLAHDVSPMEATAVGSWEAARAWALPIHAPTWLDDGELSDYSPTTDPAFRDAAEAVMREFDFTALRQRYAGLELPVLLLWGEWDPVIPFAVGERLLQTLPCARLVVWPRTLHRLHAAHPEAVADSIAAFVGAPAGC